MAGKPAFPKWVPKAARKRIVDELAKPNLEPEIRELCVRLAECEAMQDVYESLPRPWNGYEHCLIDHVILKYRHAISIQQPPPIVPDRAESIARTARMMIDEMRAPPLHDDALFLCERMWPGHPSITFDKLIAVLEQIATFYDYVSTERRNAIVAADDPPLPTKRGAKRAPEGWFSQAMSKFFLRNAGKPMDRTVEFLTDVVFDVQVETGIAKQRRRAAGAHFRKKSK
jgi:hypothetical protein